MTWSPDLGNAIWELSGGAFILMSVVKLHREKMVRGVSWIHVGFFAAWGWWNIYYYAAIDQWLSWVGGLSVVTFNTIWLGQLIYYTHREKSLRSFYGVNLREEGSERVSEELRLAETRSPYEEYGFDYPHERD